MQPGEEAGAQAKGLMSNTKDLGLNSVGTEN
jgi:hypothetical protein